LAEHLRWHDDDTLRARIAEDPEPVAEELADVLYWTLLLAHDLGIDLEAALTRKMLKNERKYPVSAARGNAKKYDEL
jgi:dCTP diphosphatase